LFPRTGIATLKGYFSGFFYLSAWGPIYVLIHSFIMDRLASQTNALAAGSVNLANWAGIDAVNQDVATMAGFLMMSVPVLALIVMRGTMSVANNLGSMLAPVQAGSDAAALERTTGNYAYGDVSYGNLNADNRQMSQWNTAPNLLAGSAHSGFREADGRMFNEYGSGHTVIDTNAAISQLPFKPTMTRGYASDLRAQGPWSMTRPTKSRTVPRPVGAVRRAGSAARSPRPAMYRARAARTARGPRTRTMSGAMWSSKAPRAVLPARSPTTT
jgi:conjugal transfer mating pair stabilization protein TraG